MDGTLSSTSRALDTRPVPAFADSALRGAGQITLMNNPLTGALIIVALAVADPWLGTLSALGLVTATGVAHAMGVERAQIRVGLYGFNGTLCGGSLAIFMAPQWSWAVAGFAVLTAAVSVPVTTAIGAILVPRLGVPGLTLPFNIVALTLLAAAPRVAHGHAGPLLEPAPENAPVDATLRAAPSGAEVSWAEGLLHGALRGVGQLFFADSVWSGALILIAIAVCSRIAAAVALTGSLLGFGTGLLLGADGVSLYHGLYGYNAYVTAVAIAGIFFVPTARAIVYGLIAAVWSTVALAGISHVLAPIGLPALTLPFCLVTLGVLLLRDLPGLEPVDLGEVTTPEQHLRRG